MTIQNIRWHLTWWFNYFTLSILLKRKINYNERRFELEKWGSIYGGWYIPTKLLKRNWVYYLVGVGDDISFDLSLVDRIGCEVFLFDPTPESFKYVGRFRKIKKIHFYPYGIWDKNESLFFKSPANTQWSSYSIVDLQNTKKNAFLAECRTLKQITNELGHKEIDFLKLDIDGAEYRVLDNLIKSNIRPKVLLVEFDQPVFFLKTYNMILRIIKSGYTLAVRDMWNFTFIKSSLKKYA
jgi:FkbM family methyltransferase